MHIDRRLTKYSSFQGRAEENREGRPDEVAGPQGQTDPRFERPADKDNFIRRHPPFGSHMPDSQGRFGQLPRPQGPFRPRDNEGEPSFGPGRPGFGPLSEGDPRESFPPHPPRFPGRAEGLMGPQGRGAAPDPEILFKQADRDGDGLLSQEEFAEALSSRPQGPQPSGFARPPMMRSEAPGWREAILPPDDVQSVDLPVSQDPFAIDSQASAVAEPGIEEEAGELVPPDPATLHGELLSQIEAMLGAPELPEEERAYLEQIDGAIRQLDPSDPEYAVRLQEILGASTEG